jgi:ABC-type nitrate/sulfonate/bicarbonate transport system permease component
LLGASGWHNGYVYNPTIDVSGDRLLLWYDGYDNHNTTNPMTPYVAGVGFATCGTVLSLPQITTTASTTVTSLVTSTSISRSITTVTVATTKLTTQTVLQNSNASILEIATAAVIGAAIALLASIMVIIRRLRPRQLQPRSAAS